MQQSQTACDASSRNQYIDRSAHRHTERAKSTVVPSSINRQVAASNVHSFELTKKPLGVVEPFVFFETLQNFRKYQVTDNQALDTKVSVEPLRLQRRLVAKEVDPDA